MSEEQDVNQTEITGPLRRRSHRRKSVYRRPVNKGRIVLAVIFLLALAGGALYYRLFMTAHYAIFLNGKPLVALATKEQSELAIVRLQKKYAPTYPNIVRFNEGALQVRPLLHKMPVSNVGTAVKTLDSQLTKVIAGWGIFVNGSPLVMLDSRENALKALSDAQEKALGDKGGVPTFQERVITAPFSQRVGKDTLVPIMTPQQVADELTHPPRKRYHTIERGESFYAVAVAHNITLEMVKQLNPGVNPQALQPGDKIRLPDETAPLTVIVR